MKKSKQGIVCIALFLSILVLILDSKTALSGAQEGLSICIRVVIPSLFPFLFLSAMLPSRILGKRIKWLRGICKLTGTPEGAESLLLLSFLSGYPVGAGMVNDAYQHGCLSSAAANRMLGFMNNAGPAFIFGMISSIFITHKLLWCLWGIHIISALLVAFILSDKSAERCVIPQSAPISPMLALEKALKSMGNICGWVMIFRVMQAILDRWIFWILPKQICTGICGFLELTSGILTLNSIENMGARFVLCSGMLAFGGLCVLMQTKSVASSLDFRNYFPGKMLQCLFGVLISSVIQNLIFQFDDRLQLSAAFYILLITGILVIIFLLKKKSCSISGANIV